MTLVVVGILVPVAVAQFLHQLGGCIAQVERHGLIAGLLHLGQRGTDAHIGRVALGRSGQIDRGLGQGDATLGPTDFHHGIEGRIGQQKGVRVGQSDVLARTDDQSASNEGGILAALNHASQPVERCIGVAAADALDERRDDVIVHLAVLIVGQRILLQTLRDDGVRHLDVALLGSSLEDEFHDVQQLAGIASAIAQQGHGLAYVPCALAQLLVLCDDSLHECEQVVPLQWFQHIHLAAAQQGADDLEGGILRSGADEGDHALLHSPQKRVLLRLGEAMDFVDEQYGAGRIKEAVLACPLDDVAHILHAACHSAECIEGCLQAVGDDAGQRSLSHSRRSPQDEARDVSRVYHPAQHSPRSHQVLLPDVIVQCRGTHPFCQWCTHGSKVIFFAKIVQTSDMTKGNASFLLSCPSAAYLRPKVRVVQTSDMTKGNASFLLSCPSAAYLRPMVRGEHVIKVTPTLSPSHLHCLTKAMENCIPLKALTQNISSRTCSTSRVQLTPPSRRSFPIACASAISLNTGLSAN